MDEDAQVERMKFEIPTLRTGLTLYTATLQEELMGEYLKYNKQQYPLD